MKAGASCRLPIKTNDRQKSLLCGKMDRDRYSYFTEHRRQFDTMQEAQSPSTPVEASMLLVGATGLVGTAVLKHALSNDTYKRIVVLTRREIPFLANEPRATQHIVDFDKLDEYTSLFDTRDVVCCLGTTHKQAGSKERFVQIDHDIPHAIARIAHAQGAQRFVLISSVGADHKSMNHYLKTKGRLEQNCIALGYHSLVILRPSLLLGDRSEKRTGEGFAKQFDRFFRWAIPKRYKGIHADTIAERILHIAASAPTGTQFLESEQIPLS